MDKRKQTTRRRTMGSYLLSGLVIMLASAGFASTAAADFSIRIDCQGTGGNPYWATTKNKIQVAVRMKSTGKYLTLRNATVPNCGSDKTVEMYFDGFSPEDIDRLRVRNSTYVWRGIGLDNDAFWIDDLSIYEGRFATRRWKSGKDNNSGWVISDQVSDGDNVYTGAGRAYPSLTWSVKINPIVTIAPLTSSPPPTTIISPL